MCGRFALNTPREEIADIFNVDILPDLLPRYNVAPTTKVLSIVEQEEERRARFLKWGLIPPWAKDPKIGARMLNARSETVHEKPSFRHAFKRRRTLIVADGFYEWKRDGKAKIPHFIQLKGGRAFGMAGLWEKWTDPSTQEETHTCSIITTGPNPTMEPIHQRMPVILPDTEWDRWLDASNDDVDSLRTILQPYPGDMQVRRVSSKVNSVKNRGPECQAPWEGDGEP